MKKDDAYDSDSCDEDYTGQPPDGDQSFIVPRRGLEPDSGPDDDPMIVERRGSPADSDSLVFEEDMGEYPDEFPDNSDDPFVSMYEMASKQRQEKRKKKQKKKTKKKAKKKANASSEGVDLLELAAFVEGGDEDAQFTDGEQESPAKGRFRQPSVCQMEEKMLEKTDFLYRKSVLYHYNDQYYEAIDAEGVVALYRQYISPGLDGVKNLRNHLDIYKCMKANPRLKYEDTDVYEYSGKYSNLDALSRFIEYLKFYDEATYYMEVEGMIQDLHEIWYDFDIETLTDEDAGVYVDRVIQMAEANGAEIQTW